MPRAPGPSPSSPYFTRSKVVNDYKAAGVLPIALYEDRILVLLGAELERTGPKGKYLKYLWRDFGGQREACDEDSAATAARECSEETLGLLASCGVDAGAVAAAAAALSATLRDGARSVRVVHALRRGAYHMFVVQVPYVTALMFRLASDQNAATAAVAGAEKTAFAWVPLHDLLRAVARAAPAYHLTCRGAVCGGRGTPPCGPAGVRAFPLHPCFANSLRRAWWEGGLRRLALRWPLCCDGDGEPACGGRNGNGPEDRHNESLTQPALVPTPVPKDQMANPPVAGSPAPPDTPCSSESTNMRGRLNSLVHCLAQADVAAALEPLREATMRPLPARSSGHAARHGQRLGWTMEAWPLLTAAPPVRKKLSRRQRLVRKRRRRVRDAGGHS
ncbi:hypothetical protein ACKKBG_A06320 [Auxenochlorella protothecoides x Auxenochlorella symbiontica]